MAGEGDKHMRHGQSVRLIDWNELGADNMSNYNNFLQQPLKVNFTVISPNEISFLWPFI